MSYLQIYVSSDKSAAEAQATLHYLRDNFPLQQSEGRFYRMSSNYILFEQPEHMVLTLEQELWMEQHGYDPRYCIRFYSDQDQDCRDCHTPFDDAPTGYCPRCYAADPYQVVTLTLQLSPEESRYLTYVGRHLWINGVESTYIRRCALTLAYIIEQEEVVEASLLETDRFDALVQSFIDEQAVSCHYCHLPASECMCFISRSNETQQERVPFTRQEYQRIQALADSCGVDVETFVHRSLGIPEVQIAMASNEAAAGYIFAHSMDSCLSTTVIWNSLSNQFGASYHLTQTCIALAEEIPWLAAKVIDLLLGAPQEQPQGEYIELTRTQLGQTNTTANQVARACTEHEIQVLEQENGCILPKAYKEFLAWKGHGAGPFMRHLNCFYPALIQLQGVAADLLLADICKEVLPGDAFVFYMQPEQHFTFFRTSEGDDPPVYAHRRYWRRSPFRKIYHHFSDFLSVQLGLYDQYLRQGAFRPQSYRTLRDRFSEMSPRVEKALAQKRKSQQSNI
jgi:hypothetical protein